MGIFLFVQYIIEVISSECLFIKEVIAVFIIHLNRPRSPYCILERVGTDMESFPVTAPCLYSGRQAYSPELFCIQFGQSVEILIIRLFVGPLLPGITQGNVIIRFLRTAGNTQVMGLCLCIPVQ